MPFASRPPHFNPKGAFSVQRLSSRTDVTRCGVLVRQYLMQIGVREVGARDVWVLRQNNFVLAVGNRQAVLQVTGGREGQKRRKAGRKKKSS